MKKIITLFFALLLVGIVGTQMAHADSNDNSRCKNLNPEKLEKKCALPVPTITFDPGGTTITSTSIEFAFASTTITGTLSTPSSSLVFSFNASPTQLFVTTLDSNNFIDVVFPSVAVNAIEPLETPLTIDVTGAFNGVPGTYPFSITIAVDGVTESATGTILVL